VRVRVRVRVGDRVGHLLAARRLGHHAPRHVGERAPEHARIEAAPGGIVRLAPGHEGQLGQLVLEPSGGAVLPEGVDERITLIW
jgi:hypothetical protein